MRVVVALGLTAVTALGSAAQAHAADTVMVNGYVYTVDRRDSVRDALAIRDGAIVYVGSNRGARRYVGKRTKVVDLRGKMVMPGLHDGHIHGVSLRDPVDCDLNWEPFTTDTLRLELQSCLDTGRGKEPDAWFEANHFFHHFLRPKGFQIGAAWLDALSTTRPIVIHTWDGHTTYANSRALQLAGITAQTPDPKGGSIERDAAGRPTGVLQDDAGDLIDAAIPPPPPSDPVKQARGGLAALNAQGVTSVFVPGTSPDRIRTFQKLRRAGGLTTRMHFALALPDALRAKPSALAKHVRRQRSSLERPRDLPRSVLAWRRGARLDGTHRLVAKPGVSVDAVKIFLDSVVQAPAQTAYMVHPYLENVGTADAPRWVPGKSRGDLYFDNPLLGRIVTALERAGVQTHVHSDGSGAARVALDAFAIMRRRNGRLDSRPSMAHNELMHPADIPRFKRLGAIPVMSFQWGKPGPDSIDTLKPYVSAADWRYFEPTWYQWKAGATIAFGSDYPVDPLKEWFALEVAVRREADWPEGFPEYAGSIGRGLPLREAIRAMTINAAYQMHQDAVTGSLERGKLADLIVLDRNLFRVPSDDISETKVQMTMVGGRIVYRQAESRSR